MHIFVSEFGGLPSQPHSSDRTTENHLRPFAKRQARVCRLSRGPKSHHQNNKYKNALGAPLKRRAGCFGTGASAGPRTQNVLRAVQFWVRAFSTPTCAMQPGMSALGQSSGAAQESCHAPQAPI